MRGNVIHLVMTEVPPFHLIPLDRFEEGTEVPFAEAVVTFTLDYFEEDGANHSFGENLQQQTAIGFAIDQNAVAFEAFDIFAMPGHPLVDPVVISGRNRKEADSPCR